MKNFITLDKYGEITIDKVIFESYYPIIFTCKSNNNDLFICVCYQHNADACGWLVGKTQPDLLIKLLRDEITVRDIIDKYATDKFKISLVGKVYTVENESAGWFDKDCLPKEDSFLCVDDGEFDEEIDYYLSMNFPKYSEKAFKEIIQTVNQISQNMAPLIETAATFAGVLHELKLPTELMSTLSIIEEIGVQLAQSVPSKYEGSATDKPVYEMSFETKGEKYSIDLNEMMAIDLTDAA